jgi:NitT/TauT family transport system ATP-binding protein/nitrate/nitrite transport system substrate-binding protein
LSRQKYLGVDSHAILSSLPGGAIAPDNQSCFWRGAATFPWRSHALWFLRQMARWDLIGNVDAEALAARVYRCDLYRAAVAPLGISVPLTDCKNEGAHNTPWQLEAAPKSIAMGPDRFCDGAVFEASPAPASF